MATRANVRTDVDTLLGDDANLTDAQIDTFIQLRYEQIYEGWRWSRRLRDLTVTLVAEVTSTTTDQVTVTNGSPTVTSAGTPFTSAMGGRQMQIGDEDQYFFIAFVSTSSVTLQDGESNSVNWPRATASGQSWRIFQTIYALPSDAEEVLSLAGDFPVAELDGGRDQLDQLDPDRSSTSDHPTHWIYAGEDSSSVREIEVWPVPTEDMALRGQYARGAPTLSDTTEIGINRGLLVYGTAADAANKLFAQTGDQAWQQDAIFYERKYNELERRFRPVDYERLSPPRTLRKGGGVLAGLRGTDFEVDRDLSEL